ncbi:hypothetical protein Tco_0879420 [Tanacetum coccineum]
MELHVVSMELITLLDLFCSFSPLKIDFCGLGSGLEWLFDIDTLTKSMNYKPVVAGNQSNGNACSKDSPDVGFKPSGEEEKKDAEDSENKDSEVPSIEEHELNTIQDKYVDEILMKFGFLTMKTASTPMETSKPLLKDENAKDVDVHLYRSMIGSLMCLTSSSLDIMFVVCACERFQITPKFSHLHAVKRIFRYLKGQPKLGLWYPNDSPFILEAYIDSDYVGASLDRKSTI